MGPEEQEHHLLEKKKMAAISNCSSYSPLTFMLNVFLNELEEALLKKQVHLLVTLTSLHQSADICFLLVHNAHCIISHVAQRE